MSEASGACAFPTPAEAGSVQRNPEGQDTHRFRKPSNSFPKNDFLGQELMSLVLKQKFRRELNTTWVTISVFIICIFMLKEYISVSF